MVAVLVGSLSIGEIGFTRYAVTFTIVPNVFNSFSLKMLIFSWFNLF